MGILAPELLLDQYQRFLGTLKLYHILTLPTGQLFNCFICDELASIEKDDARANLLHLAQQVTRKKDRFALTCELVQQITHLNDAYRIKSVGRFVENEQVRIVEQGNPYAQALFHPKRVRLHTILLARLQPDLLQNSLNALARHAAKNRAYSP